MKLDIKLVKPQDFSRMMEDEHTSIQKASTARFREAGDKIKRAGRAEIAAGGFSKRWQNALRVIVYPKTGFSGSPKIFVYHKIKYAGQFEAPQVIQGHPLLWLPIEHNLPGGKKMTPASFPGPLRGGRHGTRPILFGQVSVRGRKKTWLPVFIGISSVNNSKRFNVTSVVKAKADELADVFSTQWES